MQPSTLCHDSIHSVLTSCSKNDEDDEDTQIYFFLQDVAQETGAFDYNDMSNIELTPEVSDKLFKFMYRYMAAADDGDESRCDRIGVEIGKYLKTIR